MLSVMSVKNGISGFDGCTENPDLQVHSGLGRGPDHQCVPEHRRAHQFALLIMFSYADNCTKPSQSLLIAIFAGKGVPGLSIWDAG